MNLRLLWQKMTTIPENSFLIEPQSKKNMPEITPFKIEICDAALEDLKQRLELTRWPEAETLNDWTQGIPLAYMQEVVDYWLHHYR